MHIELGRYLKTIKLIMAHGHVTCAFGVDTIVIVPLVKDKSRNINELDNYRPITLTPVIANIFSMFCYRGV